MSILNRYQKNHHTICYRPRTTPISTEKIYHFNQNNNSPYIFNQYANSDNSSFNEFKTSLSRNEVRRSFQNNNGYNYTSYEPDSINYTLNEKNNGNYNFLKRKFSLRKNKNFHDNYTVKPNNSINYNEDDLIWNGALPENHYKRLVGPNPYVVRKKSDEIVNLKQNVDVKYLIPPSRPPPGIT